MPYTASGKVKLQFEENGHGYPILFRHGFEFDSRAWDLQVRHLARNYRCTTYNGRGLPPSDIPEELISSGWNLPVEDAAAAMCGLSIPRAHLVGSSMPGHAALQFFLRCPEKASAIVATRTSYRCPPLGHQDRIGRTGPLWRESYAAMPDCMKLQSINCITENGSTTGERRGYYTVYPRGRGAS
jgi:pimeloyl-ACP methyl ester carboxylesterase